MPIDFEQPGQGQGDGQVERQDHHGEDERVPQADAEEIGLDRGALDHLDEIAQPDEGIAAAQAQDRTADPPGAVVEEHQDECPAEHEEPDRFIQQQRHGYAGAQSAAWQCQASLGFPIPDS